MENTQLFTCITRSAEETKRLAASLVPYLRPNQIIVLTGDLGAGKTQFAQGLASALGIDANVVSPTFNIVISYEDGRLPLFHFDLYRLESAEELEDIGFYEYLESNGVTLVEWGDKFPDSLPSDRMELVFRVNGAEERVVSAQAFGESHARLLAEWARSEGFPFQNAR